MTIANKTINTSAIFHGDTIIWIVLFLLCSVSIVEVYSASSNMSFKTGEFWHPILMHTLYLAMGVGVAWVVHRIPCRYFGWIVILGPAISILLLILAFFTESVNDAERWLKVGGFSFQPSEIAKGSLIIAVAWILSTMRDEKGATSVAFKWILGVSVVICGLIAPENLSTAGLTFVVVLLMMYIGRVPWKHLTLLITALLIAGSAGLAFLKWAPDAVLDATDGRVTTWASRLRHHTSAPDDPLQYDLSTNAQITQSHIAIATCGIVGKGPGNSTVRDFLPQAYSDFIYAIILEELGWLGGFIVMMLYIILLFRAGRIASRCEKNFPAFVIMGLALLISVQALVNMSVAVGLFPVTGQPLPLVSRGGSSIMVNCAYIGMMLSVSRTARQKTGDPAPIGLDDSAPTGLADQVPDAILV